MTLYIIILGFIQGLTEFLPVSSSGHLVLLSNLFGIEDSLFVSIMLHVATLLSILVVLRKEVWELIRHPFSEKTMKVVLATIPTCLIVLVLMPIVNASFSGAFLPVCFLVSAVLLFVTSVVSKKKVASDKFTVKNAVVMGIAQGLAVFPGISRSGSTICAGLLSGGDKEEVAKFSFLMSIPVILLSMAMEVYKIVMEGNAVSVDALSMTLGFLVAFLVGIFAIKIMLAFTKKASFKWFSFYLIIITVLTLCIQFLK